MRRKWLANILFNLYLLFPKKFPLHGNLELSQPFFILGSGRNGSTLLNRILNVHPQLFLPSEQYFLGISIYKFGIYNHILPWRDLVKIILGEIYPKQSSHTWSENGMDLSVEMMHWPKENQYLSQMIDRLYRNEGKSKSNWSYWGDSTPLNTYYLDVINALFPQSKWIFLVRDGRDVVSSYKKGTSAYFGKLAEPTAAAHHWNHAQNQLNKWKTKKDILEIRYESFINNPEQELTKICNYLKVSNTFDWKQYTSSISHASMYNEPQHANIVKPIMSNNTNKWESILTKEERNACEQIMRDNLIKWNYL